MRKVKKNKDSIKSRIIFYICLSSLVIATIIALLILILVSEKVIYVDQSVYSLLSLYTTIFLACLISGIIIGSTIALIGLNPVHLMSNAIKSVAEGNYTVKLKELRFRSSSSEMKGLVKSFNEMVDKLNKTQTLSEDFISNISHEFKTPLHTILGYASLLDDNKITETERKSYVKIITDAITSLSNLVSNILKLNKLEKQDIKIEVSRFNLDEQLREAIILLQSLWENKNINIDLTTDLFETKIKSDKALLLQVWENLISNAIKYSKNNSDIKVSIKNSGLNVEVTISDNGIGMSEETVNHIFEKFYQGDVSHSKNGNGLGMCLVKDILNLLECEIDINSKIDEGTDIVVTIPYSIME